MLPDRVSNPGPLTYESGALSIALRGPAPVEAIFSFKCRHHLGEVICQKNKQEVTKGVSLCKLEKTEYSRTSMAQTPLEP